MGTDETRIYFRASFPRRKMFSWRMVPCVIFEDEHLLAVAKPAGWNTHAPSPYAGEGVYDWLKHREPRWASLAILHRLDKETSGVLVFGKTPLVNKSLTEQFTERRVYKKYLLLTDKPVLAKEFIIKTALVRVGEKYASHAGGELAETRFTPISDAKFGNSRLKMVSAEPLTGRTHQIRVHAAENGFPILGDTLYGGTASSRVFLHAGEIAFTHPARNEPVKFFAPVNFDIEPRLALRTAVIEPEQTNAFHLIHGASDGWPGWFVEKLGDFLLSQSEASLNAKQNDELLRLAKTFSSRGAYHKTLSRHVRKSNVAAASPQLIAGSGVPVERRKPASANESGFLPKAATTSFEILENGIRYEMSFNEGYSVGLFLDQRDNRRRLLTGHIAVNFPLFKSEIGNRKSEILNCFAYTCGFSVCAAKAGARTTSLDLSKKYLEWGKRNFALNGLDPAAHDFIYGDTFDWLRRLAKKGRAFDAVVLDPPTFSQSKEHGTFRAEKDYGRLVNAALPLVKPGGILFASTNAADWPPEDFLANVDAAVHGAKRKILQRHYVPQPPDFPISRAEPAYLKTMWLRIG
jgi:23S rRNA (cytosine1962-C5)-methyltransferase